MVPSDSQVVLRLVRKVPEHPRLACDPLNSPVVHMLLLATGAQALVWLLNGPAVRSDIFTRREDISRRQRVTARPCPSGSASVAAELA